MKRYQPNPGAVSDDQFANSLDEAAVRTENEMSPELSRLVPTGWIASHWLERLQNLADWSRSLNPEISVYRQRQADAVRHAIRRQVAERAA